MQKMQTLQIIIDRTGHGRCIYSETLPLETLGQLTIRRASHVEPDSAGHWQADLSPVKGPQLGPFATRSEALAAETAWLSEHWLPLGD